MDIWSSGGRGLGHKLQLIDLPSSSLEGKKDLVSDYKDAFPIIGTPVFSLNLKKVFSIDENGVEKGLVFNHRLIGKFSSIAKYDFSILVYSNYQRQGIGRKVVDLISSLGASAVFIVPKANEKSLSFFRTLSNLSHVRNGELFVFNSL